MNWTAPQRPVEYAERALVTAILEGIYPSGTNLPAERELCVQLGVTRPTLREVIRRLESGGWLDVQQGKPTRVRDFWREGGLNVLGALVRYSQELPEGFITNLLEVRLAMAPAYARSAVEHSAHEVAACLREAAKLDDKPECIAAFDWKLHYTLTIASGNPIYTLILNGFAGFYEQMATIYFKSSEARGLSHRYYASLRRAAEKPDPEEAEAVTRAVMQASIQMWKDAADEKDMQVTKETGG